MSRFHKPTFRSLICGVFVAAFAWMAPAPAANVDQKQTNALSSVDTWANGIDRIRSGRFSEAGALLRQIAEKSAAPEKATTWLDEWLQAEQTRRELTEADYEVYVGRAKKWHEKKDFNKALQWAYWAMLNSPDQEAFRRQIWVTEIRQDALEEANRLRDKAISEPRQAAEPVQPEEPVVVTPPDTVEPKADAPEAPAPADDDGIKKDDLKDEDVIELGTQKDEEDEEESTTERNWRDAHAIYYALSLIFENDKTVDKLRKECLEHARLEEIYKTERDWQESLDGITEQMVIDAFGRIDTEHVEEADFKKLTVAGYEELLLIAQSKILKEQFEGLNGQRGEEFISRIERKLRQVKDDNELTKRRAVAYFQRALRINHETAKIDDALLIREYANSALGELDEFSSMIWPYDYREFDKRTRGDFKGVGIQIRNRYNSDLKDTEILVVSPLENSPAYRAGIQAEDVIVKVNGKDLLGIELTKAVEMITGPENTEVALTIRRKMESGEEKELEVALKRENIKIQSVKSHQRRANDEQNWDLMIDPELGVGYVRVVGFQENTVRQLRTSLSEAQAEGMRALILDLRSNPGGLLRSAVEMAEMFLPSERRIVSTKGLRKREWAVDTQEDGRFMNLPLIVLINESSASASEIVSGAIKDHARGLIIGERSFGKFSVQNLIPLAQSEAHLKLTTARYYLPSGRSLHREPGATEWGVEPDITVSVAPKERSKIIFMRRDADVIGAVKTSSEAEMEEALKPDPDDAEANADEEEPDPNHYPNRDPQLETALLVMRMHLLSDEVPQMAKNTQPTPEKVTPE